MNSSERLKTLIDFLKENPNSFSVNLGLASNTRVRHVLNGRNNLTAKFVKMIIDVYPKISYEWLLNGEGNMLVNESEIKNLSIENIVKFLHQLPQNVLDENETWQLFLETQYQSQHMKKVAKEIEELKKRLKSKLD